MVMSDWTLPLAVYGGSVKQKYKCFTKFIPSTEFYHA